MAELLFCSLELPLFVFANDLFSFATIDYIDLIVSESCFFY